MIGKYEFDEFATSEFQEMMAGKAVVVRDVADLRVRDKKKFDDLKRQSKQFE